MNNQLTEVFAPPIGLKPIAKVDGDILYGSPLLNRTFLIALEKCGRTSPAYSKFEMLLEQGKLVAGHQTPGIFSFRDWKLHKPSSSQTLTMGFYDRVSKKVYILISNTANKWSMVDNNFLGILVIHELVHMFSDVKKALFINMFKKELIAYYRELWKQLFSISDIPDKTTEKIVRFLFINIENNKVISNNSILKYNSLMSSELRRFTTLKENEFNKILTDYMVLAKMFLINTDRFLQSQNQFKHILMPMYNAYQRAFSIRNMTTVCIQELVFPSEVIAIASEDMRYGNKALKAIARI
jgi:hypothetical protein